MSGDGDIRVLHVDDDREFAEVAAMHLERTDGGLDVVTESSALDGLDRLRSDPVDCVVSDHDMPKMNGLDFLKAVREERPEFPFILFTGKGNEEIASDAISAGVTEYLQKDVGTDQYTVLANRIRRAVGEKRAKSALEESERQLSTLISNLPGMVYRARNEAGWPMEFVSDGAAELVGYGADTIESGAVTWGSLIHDADADRVNSQAQTCIDADEPFEVSYRVTTENGETRWMWERGRVVGSDEDGVELLEGFVTDITARKQREEELEREREFTETLVDTLDDVFYLVNPDGELLRWNDTTSEVLGYDDERLSAMTLFDLVPEPFHDEVAEAVERTVRTGQATFDVPLVTSEGERIRHEFRGSLIEDGAGDTLGVAGIARDVTTRRERERELGRYETIVEAVGDPVYALDADGTFTFVNEAIEPMTGYAPDDLVGEHIGVVMTDEDVERGDELIQELLSDPDADTATMEMDVVTRWGERIPSENNLALLPSDGNFAGTAGVIRDIHERKAREERLSEFASVVSHDLRNPLNVVQGRLSLAQETDDVSHLDAASTAADRMEKLIEDLLTLARQGDAVGAVETIDVATAAEAAWENVDTPGATLDVADSAQVDADPERLRELLENLFRNAVEHGSTSPASQARQDAVEHGTSPRGGHDDTGGRRPPGEAPLSITVGTFADGAGHNGFYVADDGPGVPPADRDQVFERGYTTAEGGTGFGLAIVEDIATAHGWSVRLTGSESGGARFEFTTSRADR